MEANILDEIDNMPEYQKIRRLDKMQYVLKIFDGNGVDLSNIINWETNIENRHIFAKHNEQFIKFASEINRHLHNFISSTYSLTSITKDVMNNYKNEISAF